ncbi:MAG TPA: hypothetical protein VK671_14725 [Mucilaginibacter sp.]|jgi:hypothetical protein|nr:hypothetical protein [Mucilaginibacter sp.]
MKLLLIIVLLFFTLKLIGQESTKDTLTKKEPVAIGELGGAASRDIKGGGTSWGYSLAVEVTPIEDWLELELGVSPTFGNHIKETDIDLLFKKPWTLSPKTEFMFGLGLAWNHANDLQAITNGVSGEIALDFMFWPAAKHRFGWYFEPAYEYGFGGAHPQSLGMNAGLLIAIP